MNTAGGPAAAPPEREWALLDALSAVVGADVLRRARRRKFAKGDIVFHEGDPGDTLHLITKGHAAVRVTTPMGDIATLTVLQPGDVFGELAVVSPGPRSSTIVALVPLETLALHRDVFDDLRHEHPEIDRLLIDVLAAELRRTSKLLLEVAFVPADKRIWRRIAELVEVFGRADGEPVVIPLTQEELAQVVAATRPTVNRVLRVAEADGVIKLSRGRLEVVDVDAVGRLAR
jgi:CRP/FNR family transcriptional regulator, cyclic AMP receptor protein